MSAKLYKLGSDGVIKKLVNGKYLVSFVLDSGCGEDLEYKAWLAEGNTPDAADVVAEPVKEIGRLVIIDRLIAAGKINDALAALNSDTVAKARWDAATSITIDDPNVAAFLTALGIQPETILY